MRASSASRNMENSVGPETTAKEQEKNTENIHKNPQNGGIMVVDDNPDNLHLLAGILRKEGYKVRPVRNSSMVFVSINSTLPELILLDIQMPEMNGFDVCQRLKANERTREIPIIFLSGSTDREDKEKAFAAGGADYISKPFLPEEVIARVRGHLPTSSLQHHTRGE